VYQTHFCICTFVHIYPLKAAGGKYMKNAWESEFDHTFINVEERLMAFEVFGNAMKHSYESSICLLKQIK